MGELNKNDDTPLMRVATSISDGAPVDWERESSGRADLRSKLGRLRLIEAVASAHRSPVAASPPAQAVPSPIAITEGPSVDIEGLTCRGADIFPSHWGPLQILEKLGEGGFGEVYRAYDPTLQRERALKLRRPGKAGDPKQARAFIEEARRLARVRHPNVLVVYGADEHNGRVGLWTELLEGMTLEQRLKTQGQFSAEEATLIGIDLCGALAAVHAAGLVHRDVKTSNVMREKGGRIVLMDFGSASEVEAKAGTSRNGERAGTAMTMAPEILLRGEAPTRAADIYGLGVLLYRLVSGRFPIETDSLAELVESHRRGEHVPLRDVRPDLPAAFVEVVERSLSADPARRYQSAGAMEQGLSARRKPPFEWRYVAAAAMAVVVGLAIWGVWPAPVPFEASLFRESAGVREKVASHTQVKLGDLLGLEVIASEPLYAYVINKDAKNEAFALFPVGLDLENPLPPRVRVQLPGRLAGTQHYWAVTSTGGTETILVVLSREPVKPIEELMAALPRAEEGRPPVYPQIEPQEFGRILRGIGGLAPSTKASDDAVGELKVLLDRLADGAQLTAGVWVRRFELENPSK